MIKPTSQKLILFWLVVLIFLLLGFSYVASRKIQKPQSPSPTPTQEINPSPTIAQLAPIKPTTPPQATTSFPTPSNTNTKCGQYIRNGQPVTVCADCGNGICENNETCTSSNVGPEASTDDCGPLYCPADCESQ